MWKRCHEKPFFANTKEKLFLVVSTALRKLVVAPRVGGAFVFNVFVLCSTRTVGHAGSYSPIVFGERRIHGWEVLMAIAVLLVAQSEFSNSHPIRRMVFTCTSVIRCIWIAAVIRISLVSSKRTEWCHRLMMQLCMQLQWYAATHQNKHGGCISLILIALLAIKANISVHFI